MRNLQPVRISTPAKNERLSSDKKMWCTSTFENPSTTYQQVDLHSTQRLFQTKKETNSHRQQNGI